jgi:hypothetical protein
MKEGELNISQEVYLNKILLIQKYKLQVCKTVLTQMTLSVKLVKDDDCNKLVNAMQYQVIDIHLGDALMQIADLTHIIDDQPLHDATYS